MTVGDDDFFQKIETDVTQNSSAQAKIALFQSLFRGREDVHSKRYENRKKGTSGYVFACANEWVPGVCEKPKIKCQECPHRRYIPISNNLIRWHLSGMDDTGKDFVMGLYPMLLDETCFFLAADFDKTSWKDDVTAFLDTCKKQKVPAVVERSRSGNGAHVWIFFEQAIPATLARKLGSLLLTKTMEQRPDIGLDSYDRLFPNQDTLPQGGLGNLIALPLQKKARDKGNSLFIDVNFTPYQDQWAFLSSVEKMCRASIEAMIQQASSDGNVIGVRIAMSDDEEAEPWNRLSTTSKPPQGPFPEKLEVVLADQIYIAKESLTPSLKNRIIRLAAFQNPEFYRTQAMRLPIYKIPRIIACAEDHPNHISLPRGCLEDLRYLLTELKIKLKIKDERNAGAPLITTFQGELRIEQKAAAAALLSHDTGVLSATTAFGKTVIASWLIAKRQVNTLILVHRRQLQEQWIARLKSFLDLPSKAIGKIGGGLKRPTGLIDVALIQSLVKKSDVDALVSQYGQIIVDECHHLSAFSFEQVARKAKAKFVTGLSATVSRKDGHHPIIWMQCGPVRYRVNAKEQAALRPFTHKVFVRSTAFIPLKMTSQDLRLQFNELYEELIKDTRRNKLICDEIIQAVHTGRFPIVLTERNEHLNCLAEELTPHIPNLIILRGGMKAKELAATMSQLTSLPETEGRVLLATGKFIGEGFDDARLDTLFLTLPISWRGTIAQYVGRLHRLHNLKTDVQVYDYADLNVPMLARMFNRRCKGYESLGYQILVPASAIPGWPAEVPLPSDPAWKADYAASVRRLVLDGVDVYLASLFVNVATKFSPEDEGERRARSATEAFLFRRLETLTQTKGLFRLNVELPIAFDGRGLMEVDLLSTCARIAIELDGPQHLGNADTYRRDRRKDRLLQQHGYTVLRFLTEDVGKCLDEVLDILLRTLVHRACDNSCALPRNTKIQQSEH